MTDKHYADRDFVAPQVPVKRTFRKAKDVMKALMLKLNPDAQSVDFSDLKAVVNGTTGFTISLVETPVNHYVIRNETQSIAFTYQEVDFNALFTSSLGFAQTYLTTQKDDVIAALPEGLEHSYNEENGELTVSVTTTEQDVTFVEDNATLCTALFQGKTFTISFVDEPIDLAAKFTATALTVDLAALLEDDVVSQPASTEAASE